MIEILLYIVIAVAAVAVILEVIAFRRNATVDLPRLWQALDGLEKSSQSLERSLKEELGKQGDTIRGEIVKLRDEAATATRQAREEFATAVKGLEGSLGQKSDQLQKAIDQKLQSLQESHASQIAEARQEAVTSAKTVREETVKSIASFNDSLSKNISETVKLQQTQLESIAAKLDKATGTTDQKFEGLKTAVETALRSGQENHGKQLDQLRSAVDEKLQGSEKRLGESLKAHATRVEQAVTKPAL